MVTYTDLKKNMALIGDTRSIGRYCLNGVPIKMQLSRVKEQIRKDPLKGASRVIFPVVMAGTITLNGWKQWLVDGCPPLYPDECKKYTLESQDLN